VGPLNHLWESCHIQIQYREFFQKQRFQHSLLQDFSLQRNLYNVTICNERMLSNGMKRATMELHRYEVDCHPGLVATRCNCFSVLSTIRLKLYAGINRHQISNHEKGALWATTDYGSDSTLTISDLLSETNFPVWIHKAVCKFFKSFQKVNFKVITIIRSP